LLLIFDLDDTLIDTSGSVTPFKMEACLKRLIQEGLAVPDFHRGLKHLLEINASSMKSRDAIDAFVKNYGGEAQLIDRVIGEMTRPLPAGFLVRTTPNAKEILQEFAKEHTLALVTGGHPPFQMEKLEKAGLDKGCFSKIAIPEDSIKGPFYEQVLKELGFKKSEALVCGDRVAMDLKPAYELGLKTVHMRWGRGTVGQTASWVDHAIKDLSELKRIIRQ
jgi:putative hydrolase of the HAD superfamily